MIACNLIYYDIRWAKAKGDNCWNERFNELVEYKKLVGTHRTAVILLGSCD